MTSIKIQRQKLWCLQTENYWFTSYKLQVYVVKIFKIRFFLSWVSSAWVSITASQKLQSSSLLECCNSLFKVSPAMIRRFVHPILHIHEELGLSRQYAVFFCHTWSQTNLIRHCYDFSNNVEWKWETSCWIFETCQSINSF